MNITTIFDKIFGSPKPEEQANNEGVENLKPKFHVQLALYKGPPRYDWRNILFHYAVRLRTLSEWSHAELVINDVCWSSSGRDGGVRSKVINLNSGRWDVLDLNLTDGQAAKALAWFKAHEGEGYDWLGVLCFILPFVKQERKRWTCFEAIGEALEMENSHCLDANDLFDWALEHLKSEV
jgi:hypothetical protein